MHHYVKFIEEACDGKLGKTAQFWLKYIKKVWLMLRLLTATRENDLELQIATLEQMYSVLFAFVHPTYARYIAVYLLKPVNLEESHPGATKLLSDNGFSVNRSDVPTRSAVDIKILQTINRHAKSQVGFIGSSRNHSAYYRWCKTRHTRASFLQGTREIVDMDNSDCAVLKEQRLPQIIKTEEEISNVNYQCYLSVQEPMSRSLPLPYKPYESATSSLALLPLFRMTNQNKVIVKRRQK